MEHIVDGVFTNFYHYNEEEKELANSILDDSDFESEK